MKRFTLTLSALAIGSLLPLTAQTGSGSSGGDSTTRDRTSDTSGAGSGSTSRDRSNDASGSGTSQGSGSFQSGGSSTRDTTDTDQDSEGTSTTETTTTTFTPDARTKVTKYFESHKSEKHGLPSGLSAKFKTKDIPTAWRTTISPGMTIVESQRTYLVEAPPELVALLPQPRTGVRYYIAGSNIVAVDSSYRVVDAINVPSIKITTED